MNQKLQNQMTESQRIQQEIENAWRMRMSEVLPQTEFPDENLSVEYVDLLKKALRFNSIMRLKCSLEAYQNMCVKTRPFTMEEIALCNEVLMAANPNELEQTLEENYNMLKTVVDDCITKYKVIFDSISVKLRREVEAKIKAGIKIVPSLGAVGLKEKKQ